MKRYCLDANVFIQGWNDYYSMDLCPEYWEILDRLAQENRIFAPIEVKKEIEKTDDNLAKWLKARPYFFQEITIEVQENLRKIMAAHSRLVDSIKQRSVADPWVIAFAMAEKAVVVTKESPSSTPTKRIKIPDVCHALNVPYLNDFDFAREVGIRFAARLTPESQ
jgi:hypothetical protein